MSWMQFAFVLATSPVIAILLYGVWRFSNEEDAASSAIAPRPAARPVMRPRHIPRVPDRRATSAMGSRGGSRATGSREAARGLAGASA